MTQHPDTADIEASGLLDGLTGEARAERAELIPYLLDLGITVEEIKASFAPMLLSARRVLGDDGTYLSAREISERTGLDVDQLMRFQRASGLPVVEDPDAPVFMRPDGDPAVHIKRFLELGFDADQLLSIVRVLAEGLSHAAEVMRYTAVATTLRPGATELDIAKGSHALVSAAAPLLGPMIQDMLMLQLRHAMETEAVNANERAAGAAARRAVGRGGLRRSRRFHPARRGGAAGGVGAVGQSAGRGGPRGGRQAGAVHQDDR